VDTDIDIMHTIVAAQTATAIFFFINASLF